MPNYDKRFSTALLVALKTPFVAPATAPFAIIAGAANKDVYAAPATAPPTSAPTLKPFEKAFETDWEGVTCFQAHFPRRWGKALLLKQVHGSLKSFNREKIKI